jgi:hypothetical protein
MIIQKIEGATWRQRPTATAENYVSVIAKGSIWTLNLIDNNNSNRASYMLKLGALPLALSLVSLALRVT